MKYSKSAKAAFKAEKARKEAYWLELVENSCRKTFSWFEATTSNKYRRNYPTKTI